MDGWIPKVMPQQQLPGQKKRKIQTAMPQRKQAALEKRGAAFA
jgi:hypothetical protein